MLAFHPNFLHQFLPAVLLASLCQNSHANHALSCSEYDSDGDEISPLEEEAPTNYRVWYGLAVKVEPTAPQAILDLSCRCQESAVLQIRVNNPTDDELEMEVEIQGDCLSGPDRFRLEPGTRGLYEVLYRPAVVGQFTGR